MADFSSLMDWTPATPPPIYNPYYQDYIPGGWIETPPKAQTGLFAREAQTSFLPKAKRVCSGLMSTTRLFTNFVATPLYCIVRQVRRQQLRVRNTLPVKVSTQKKHQHSIPSSPAPEPSPESLSTQPTINQALDTSTHRSSAASASQVTQNNSPATHQPSHHNTFPTYSTTPIQTRLPRASKRYYPLPKLEDFLSQTTHPTRGTKRRRDPQSTGNVMSRKKKTTDQREPSSGPSFDFSRSSLPCLAATSQGIQTPMTSRTEGAQSPHVSRVHQSGSAQESARFTPPPDDATQQNGATLPNPAEPDQFTTSLKSPYPILPPPSLIARPTSPPSETDLVERDGFDTDSDSDEEYLLVAERPSIREGLAPITLTYPSEICSAQTSTGVAASPSVSVVKTPKTSVVVRRPTSLRALNQDEALDESLLSPPRIRGRLVTSPNSSNLIPVAHTKTPESDISSTWEVSPRDMLPIKAANSSCGTVASSSGHDISPNVAEDSPSLLTVLTGGGSPTPDARVVNSADYTNQTIISSINIAVEGRAASIPPDEAQSSSHIDEQDKATSGHAEHGIAEQPRTPTKSNGPISQADSLKSSPQFSATESVPNQIDGEVEPITPVRLPIQAFQELSLEKDFDGESGTPKANIHSAQKSQRLTRAETKRLEALKQADTYAIGPLTEEWDGKIDRALRNGIKGYQAKDLVRVVPLCKVGGTSLWLNDEVINGYLDLIVKHGNQNDRPTQKIPSFVTFNSFFYSNLNSKGYEGVRRWSSRKKIAGKALLETEYVFIPINLGAHWTLCVVSGKRKTVTHYNSLGSGGPYADKVFRWVEQELGSSFKKEEWTVDKSGESPQQANMDDCGVFTITSARQIMLGLTPMSYGADEIPLQRRRIVAELINEGLIQSL